MKIEVSEEERQMLLLALGHLAQARPGWDYALNKIAKKFDNVDRHRAVTYDEYRRIAGNEVSALRLMLQELKRQLEGPVRSYDGHFWERLRGCIEEADEVEKG